MTSSSTIDPAIQKKLDELTKKLEEVEGIADDAFARSNDCDECVTDYQQTMRLQLLRSILYQLNEYYAKQVFPDETETFRWGLSLSDCRQYTTTEKQKAQCELVEKELQDYNLQMKDWIGLNQSLVNASHALLNSDGTSHSERTLKYLISTVDECAKLEKWPNHIVAAWTGIVSLYMNLKL